MDKEEREIDKVMFNFIILFGLTKDNINDHYKLLI